METLDNVPQVIFTTAYDEFALKAFEVNALDYLLKPIQPERLKEGIAKLPEVKNEKEAVESTQLTLNDQVFVKDGDKCWFVSLSNIRLF